MIAAITTGFQSIITFVGNVISAITGTVSAEGGISGAWGSLLPVIGLGIAVMFVMFAITTVKSLIKGY